uniref:Uncharacterized protein n=2 Tax=Meloidogyne floridensis TaxID=298350 RepID=A0A915NNE7_9BILA
MVAMFSFFCEAAEPIFNNCFSSTNGGYDYLMFPNENRRKHASLYRKVSIANKCSVVSIPQINSARFSGRISRTCSVSNVERLHKSSSAPPSENFSVKEECVNNFLYSRPNSFHKLNVRRKSSVNSRSRTRIDLRNDGSTERKTSGFGRLLHFFESINPLNGFKDKDDFEEYLYNRSSKIEPKNGEIPNPKPKHSLEALKSPGVRQQQKTPTSANAPSATPTQLRASKSSTKSSVSSPRSPNQPGTTDSGSGNLLSPSHMNVPFWSSPPSGSSTNSPASLMTTEDQNFAVVDINPGQFPRWLADTTSSGRVNPAFISEYVPSAAAAAMLPSALSHSSNESPPLSSSPGVNSSTYPHSRRKPPVPLCIGESHFTFPPPLPQQQHPQFGGTFRKPPAPPPQHHQNIQHQSSEEPSPSFLSPTSAFPLAKPPSARKKLPSEGSQGDVGDEKSSMDSPVELPPKLPPRLNLLTKEVSTEATAPPRPPKKLAALNSGKSPTCENQQNLSISSTTASPFDTEAIAPPLPPKPKGMKK